MENNNITFINVGSYAIYFMPVTSSEARNQKKIKTYINVLKEYIWDSHKRHEYSEIFIYGMKEVTCLVCANAKLTMGEVASLIKKGEDTPFDEWMNNETVVPVPDSNIVENGGHYNIVLHKDDIGSIGEMGNESMPFPFNWNMAKIIQGSSLSPS